MRSYTIFLLAVVGIFIIDQSLKEIFLSGYTLVSSCISLELHINYGVAFSMFSFLGEYLKWIQLSLIIGILLFFIFHQIIKEYPLSSALILGGAIGNLYDRFTQGGVVDYVYWHCGFDFAVFNFADVMIDLGVGILFIIGWMRSKNPET